MTTSKIYAFARYVALSALALAATALASAPASAATNCLQPENVPYSLVQPLTAFQQAKHNAAIVACKRSQRETQQSFSVGQNRAGAPMTTGSIARKSR
jgi:hypothetical protein